MLGKQVGWEAQKIVQNRWDRTKDGRQRDKEGELDRQTRQASHHPVVTVDPPCLLYGYSPASDGISNSLINQELCYVTLPLPLTHRRENHHSFFFFFFFPAAQRLYITVCIPHWTINTLHQACSQDVTEISEIYPDRGSKSQENLPALLSSGDPRETGPGPISAPNL